jgi:hypothetical protein
MYLKLPYNRKGEFSPSPHFLKKDDPRGWKEGESKNHLPESSIKTLCFLLRDIRKSARFIPIKLKNIFSDSK